MRITKYIIFALVLTSIVFAQTVRAEQEAEAPAYGNMDISGGKALFNDKTLGNGKAGKSCNSCHPNGRGLSAAGDKQEFNIFGKKQNSLEEAVNFCIVNALKGSAIDTKSKEMNSIVSYIKSIK